MITQQHRADYSERNQTYNGRMNTLVDSILGTHLVYPEYVPINHFSPALPSAAQAHKEIHVVKGPHARPPKSRAEFDLHGLASYEQVVFSYLAWGSYDLHCIVGEMGSGKTAMAKQLARVLATISTLSDWRRSFAV